MMFVDSSVLEWPRQVPVTALCIAVEYRKKKGYSLASRAQAQNTKVQRAHRRARAELAACSLAITITMPMF